MNALYSFAWNQDYLYNEYVDVKCLKSDMSCTLVTNELPSKPVGYQIKDYDNDSELELLIVTSENLADSAVIGLHMYEYDAQSKAVLLSADYVTQDASFMMQDGLSRCYSVKDGNGIRICCDNYDKGPLMTDGVSITSRCYTYSNGAITKSNECYVIGSCFDTWDVINGFASVMVSIDEQDAQTIMMGYTTAYDYLAGSESIVDFATVNIADVYSVLENMSAGEARSVGTTAVQTDSWLPFLQSSLREREVTAVETQVQSSDQSFKPDYMYIDIDYMSEAVIECYYLEKSADGSVYNCYDMYYNDTGYFCPYDTAKNIADNTLGGSIYNSYNMPNAGGKMYLVWNSPYGLCAYYASYSDYLCENNIPYILNENEIIQYLAEIGIPISMVPSSDKTE